MCGGGWCVEMVVMWGYGFSWWFSVDREMVDDVWCEFVFEDE